MEGKPPRETLLLALDLFEPDASAGVPMPPDRFCVDLGCGDGRDSVELLRRGWRVLAIDGHPEAFQRLVARPDLKPTPRLSMQMCELEDVELPPALLVNASYALPFCRPHAFDRLWRAIRAAILPGGRFSGQFFGPRHSWAVLPDRSHHSEEQVRLLLDGMKLEHFEEEQRDGAGRGGEAMHWQIFHVVAQQR